jgi:hypothetical protein
MSSHKPIAEPRQRPKNSALPFGFERCIRIEPRDLGRLPRLALIAVTQDGLQLVNTARDRLPGRRAGYELTQQSIVLLLKLRTGLRMSVCRPDDGHDDRNEQSH